MEINPLQPNRSITKEGSSVPTNNTNFSNTNTADLQRLSGANDTVSLSQEAKDLANKKTGNENYIYDNSKNMTQKDEKNDKPSKNLSAMTKRFLHYYINDNKDLAIKVIDKETRKVVKEIPPEEVQKLKTAIKSIMEEMNNTEDLQAALNKLV
ncbi:MAG: flagellar protein FlaG [Nitrospinae bacterium]|nr:flagellar protein FlaG [Nitrospinota bacterium]